MPVCLAPNCRNRSGAQGNMEQGVHLYRFPNRERSPERYEKWLKFCQVKSVSDSRGYVCSHHFLVTDIDTSRLMRQKLLREIGVKTSGPRLCRGAVPNIMTKTLKRRCYVKGCISGPDLFPFPHRFFSHERFSEWFKFCQQDIAPSARCRICNQHFTPLDFEEHSDGRRTLNSTARPSILPGEQRSQTDGTTVNEKENYLNRQQWTRKSAKTIIIIRTIKQNQSSIQTPASNQSECESKREVTCQKTINTRQNKTLYTSIPVNTNQPMIKVNNQESSGSGQCQDGRNSVLKRWNNIILTSHVTEGKSQESLRKSVKSIGSNLQHLRNVTSRNDVKLTRFQRGNARSTFALGCKTAVDRNGKMKITGQHNEEVDYDEWCTEGTELKQVVGEHNTNVIIKGSGQMAGGNIRLKINNTTFPHKTDSFAQKNKSLLLGMNNSDFATIEIEDSSEEDEGEIKNAEEVIEVQCAMDDDSGSGFNLDSRIGAEVIEKNEALEVTREFNGADACKEWCTVKTEKEEFGELYTNFTTHRFDQTNRADGRLNINNVLPIQACFRTVKDYLSTDSMNSSDNSFAIIEIDDSSEEGGEQVKMNSNLLPEQKLTSRTTDQQVNIDKTEINQQKCCRKLRINLTRVYYKPLDDNEFEERADIKEQSRCVKANTDRENYEHAQLDTECEEERKYIKEYNQGIKIKSEEEDDDKINYMANKDEKRKRIEIFEEYNRNKKIKTEKEDDDKSNYKVNEQDKGEEIEIKLEFYSDSGIKIKQENDEGITGREIEVKQEIDCESEVIEKGVRIKQEYPDTNDDDNKLSLKMEYEEEYDNLRNISVKEEQDNIKNEEDNTFEMYILGNQDGKQWDSNDVDSVNGRNQNVIKHDGIMTTMNVEEDRYKKMEPQNSTKHDDQVNIFFDFIETKDEQQYWN